MSAARERGIARVRPRGPGPRAATFLRGRVSGGRALALAAAMLAAPALSRAATLPGEDTVSVRIETGASADFTNELYYEDAYIDTTFLGRRLVDTPEPRYAGVLIANAQGTWGGRRAARQVRNELSLGDKIRRDALTANWRDEFAPDWRLVLNPALEWRRDRSFERDQEEWRGSFRGRLRRSFQDETSTAELGAQGELVRSSGAGAEFLPDRNTLRGSLALDHLGLFGDEWRVGYSLAARVFPDSATRDHLEHGWEGRLRRAISGGHGIAVETSGRRRQTRRIVSTSRDNYWEETVALEGEWRPSARWSLRPRVEGEAIQYDLEDPTVYFDYRVARARLALRFEPGVRWSLTMGPRAERLWAPLNPAEAYRELAGVIELEGFGGRALWSVMPVVGWRNYVSADGVALGLHSSFAFYELDGFLDQPLLLRLRLRALGSVRYESHTDPSQNAASLHLSLFLRWGAR